ncbi:MAG: polysaccharide biosynthesis protein [Methanomassiliicoccales archaeon]|nr:polysaccharide biosynthesis protein [Methanomassiliicoccales archaeon]
MDEAYSGKTLLVTGGAGSIGSEIVKDLVRRRGAKAIRVMDTNETGLFDLENEVDSKLLRPLIGDIRDRNRIRMAMDGVDTVFHAAALKHVPLCEYNPFEAVKTNVEGTQNLLDAALECNVARFITISTDKAVSPNNVMGATKLLAERLTIAANGYKGARRSAFSVVRFGNVLNSRGSLLPVIKNQALNGQSVTLTDERMTRFVMKVEDAVDLVLKAGALTKGGETFILKMPCIRTSDLMDVAIEGLAEKSGKAPVQVRNIGIRAGEKLHETLMTDEEAAFAVDQGQMYVLDNMARIANGDGHRKTYSSEHGPYLSKGEIRALLSDIDYFK